MKLFDQVCALEYSKKLSELGVKQESLFYWANNKLALKDPISYIDSYDFFEIIQYSDSPRFESEEEVFTKYSAFTTDELNEIIFKKIFDQLEVTGWPEIEIGIKDGIDGMYYRITNNITDHIIDDKNLCNCYAKLLIIFIENGLVKLDDLNKG